MDQHQNEQNRQQRQSNRYHSNTSISFADDNELDKAELNDHTSIVRTAWKDIEGMESFDRLNLLVVLNDDESPKCDSIRYKYSPSEDMKPPCKVNGKVNGFDDISTDIETDSAFSSVTLHSPSSPTKIKRLLYVAHLLSQLTEVVWQFTIILYLCFILPSSLLLVSTYGLTVGLTSVLLGGKLGSMLDSKDKKSRSRMDGIKVVLLSHGICIASCIGCSIAILWLLQNKDESSNDFNDLGLSDVVEEDNVVISNNSTMTSSSSYQSLKNLLHHDPESSSSPYIVATSLVILHIFGALSEALNRVSAVALEKDWVVTVISYLYDDDTEETEADNDDNGRQEEADPASLPPTTICDRHLRDANVMMRQISLLCKVLGPALAGFFLHFSTSDNHIVHENEEDQVEHENTERHKFMWSMFVVGLLAIVALVTQYICMRMVYHYVPRLGVREGSNSKDDDAYGDDNMGLIKHEEEGSNGVKKASYFTELQVYLSQSISYGGIALALLHMNVLTVGAIMTSFLLSKGLSLDVLGMWRGMASILGLAGTFAYKFSSARTTLKFTALWSIGYFLFWLTICYGSVIYLQDDDDDDGKEKESNNALALTILIIGLYASRIGLWTFDMTISQMMQELVSEDVRCAVGGTQHALESFFYMLSFGLGLIYPEPDQFHILVVFGYGAVVLAFFTVLFEVYWNEWIHI